jgi:hypothetical protein
MNSLNKCIASDCLAWRRGQCELFDSPPRPLDAGGLACSEYEKYPLPWPLRLVRKLPNCLAAFELATKLGLVSHLDPSLAATWLVRQGDRGLLFFLRRPTCAWCVDDRLVAVYRRGDAHSEAWRVGDRIVANNRRDGWWRSSI